MAGREAITKKRDNGSTPLASARLIASVLLIAATIFLVWIRPIHQDDGWYASYAFSFLRDYFMLYDYSVWDFKIPDRDTVQSGFIFRLLQIPFIFLFGPNILFTKALVFCTAALLLIGAVKLAQNFSKRLAFLFPAFLLFWPGFSYHFYNRPELLAVTAGLFGLVLLTRKEVAEGHIIIAYIIPFIMFDLHPISVFWVFGVYCWYAVTSVNQWRAIATGCFYGVTIYLAGNALVNGSLGVFSPLLGMALETGDHYVPLFEPNLLNNIIEIALSRFSPFFKFFGISLIWLIIIFHLRDFYSFYKTYFNFFLYQVIFFLLLSTLLTEAVSNGFMLYSSMTFFFFIFTIAVFLFEHSGNKKLFNLLVSAPTAFTLLYVNFNYSETYLSYIRNARNVDMVNSEASKGCIDPGDSGYMRPTFAFQYSEYGGTYKYPFYILLEMQAGGKTFADVLFYSGADFIALDDAMKRDLFHDDSSSRELETFNPFYRAVEKMKPSLRHFDSILRDGALIEACKAFDFSHGETTFYYVDREQLAEILKD